MESWSASRRRSSMFDLVKNAMWLIIEKMPARRPKMVKLGIELASGR